MDFAGKIAVVTGGAKGIGRAIAAALIAENADLVILDIDQDAVAKTADEIGAHGAACDVTQPSAIQAIIAHITQNLGNIDKGLLEDLVPVFFQYIHYMHFLYREYYYFSLK